MEADYYKRLGNSLRKAGRFNEAIVAYRQVIQLSPNDAAMHNNLGALLREKGSLDEAIAILRRAIELKPDFVEAYTNLGAAMSDGDQFDEAISLHRRAVELNPENALANMNLGSALRDKGEFDDAMAAIDLAIQLKPDLAMAHYLRGMILLLRGDFSRGFPEFEWRIRLARPFTSILSQPRWERGALNARTILLHAEGGFGDTINFLGCLSRVQESGGRVIIRCQRELVALLQGLRGVERIISSEEPLPVFDVHCPIMSLPLALGTDEKTPPIETGYLTMRDAGVGKWKSRMERIQSGLKVGVVWAGNPKYNLDRRRSIPLGQFSPLAAVPGVHFFSLQKGEAARQHPPEGMALIDWTADLSDFTDTAGLIANLDLVIAVDTALAHLTGALGKEVWILLPFVPDWRWGLNRENPYWYPTARLFRQKSLGDWGPVIQAVAEQLRARAK